MSDEESALLVNGRRGRSSFNGDSSVAGDASESDSHPGAKYSPGVVHKHPARTCIIWSFTLTLTALTSMFFTFGFSHGKPLLGPLFIASIVPSFFIMWLAYRKTGPAGGEVFEEDKVPVEVLIVAFWLGIVSTVPIAFLGFFTNYLTQQMAGGLGDNGRLSFGALFAVLAVEMFVFTSFLEELAKYVVSLYAIRRRSLGRFVTHPYGVILFALCCALGFAGIENSMYVLEENSDNAGWYLALTRALMSVPLHGTTGALIGVGLARRTFFGSAQGSSYGFWRVLAVPIFIHGLYDFIFVIPFRDGDLKPDQRNHQLHTNDNTLDVGELLGFLYLFNVGVVIFGVLYARSQIDRVLRDYNAQSVV